MRRRVLCFALFGGLLLCGCARDDEPSSGGLEPAQVLSGADASVTDFKNSLLEAHAAADAAETEQMQVQAARSMESAFGMPVSTPAALELRQELAARAAAIWIELGRDAAAESLIQSGLELSSHPSAARAQLLMVQADLAEGRGRDELARASLMAALAINQQLFEQEIEEP